MRLSTIFWEWYRELLSRGLKLKGRNREIDSVLVKELFATLVKNHAEGHKSVVCNGVGDIPGSLPWNEISEGYDRIFSEWKEGSLNNHVDRWEAVFSDTGNLDYAANNTRFYNGDQARIVIFGHTHKCGFTSNLMQSGTTGDPPSPTTIIYANAGGWANEANQCTFVETEVAGSKHHVRLMEWFRDMHGQYKPIKARAYSEDYIEL